ncbi:MAG TPA: hypothetical protein EYO31_00400, partial [Phycisphaerales bacterium]|nr:hypothetical protein [Phycisphaerales bacterium]
MKVLISNIVDRYLSPKKVASTWLEATAAHLGLDHIPEISDAAHRIAHILSSNGVQDKEVAYGVAWALQKRYGTSKDRTALDKALSKCAGDYSDAIAWGQTEICQKIATDWARIAGKGFLPGKSEPAKDTSSTPSTPSSGGGGGGNCFLPGTSVSTPIGNVFIENLSDGDEVLTFDPTSGKISNRPLKATSKWFDVPEHLTIGLETGSEIRCTASHRMLTSDGFKKAGSLTPEDTLRNVEN